MQTVRGALPRCPELVDIRRNAQALAPEGLGCRLDDLSGGPELPEGGELFCERFVTGKGSSRGNA